MNKKNNIIVFVMYLNKTQKDEIIKFDDINLAKNKFYEIEKINTYEYLELGVDNVKSSTEGNYDILETYKISNILDILQTRWKETYNEVKKEIEIELNKVNLLKKFNEQEKILKELTNFLFENKLPNNIENNLSPKLLQYKKFKIKQLFDEDELKIVSNMNIDLDIPYSIKLKDLIDNTKCNIKLKNNKIVEVINAKIIK